MSEQVTALLWDVHWTGDGFGKHGTGPFATERQARACLRAAGWPGEVRQVRVTLDQDALDRILRRGRVQQVRLLSSERPQRIVWPADGDPAMWAEADGGGHWDIGFYGALDGEPAAGQALGGHEFALWHAAMVEAMHWAYRPESQAPEGWKRVPVGSGKARSL